jgi:DNA repair protein RecO (recombination protein O)
MDWSDEAIILSVRPHGETAALVEVLTRAHGRSLGLVHGGRSRRQRPVLQPGNHIEITWKGRLAEHLGHFTVEPLRSYGAETLDDGPALTALGAMTALAHLLAERDPHPSLFEITLFVLGFLDDPSTWPALVVRWELALLDELGFGIDLSRCAASGTTEELVYVSPRTGRAVSRAAGEPYRDKLLELPAFLIPRRVGERAAEVTAGDVEAGFRLTGHFLQTRVLQPIDAGLPDPRQRLPALVRRMQDRPVSGPG